MTAFPKLGGGTWELTEEQVQAWQGVFSSIDVLRECKIAYEWLVEHPKRQKRNVKLFLWNWLKREHRKMSFVSRTGAYREPGPRKAQATNYAEVEKVVYARCIREGDTEEDARRIARQVVHGMRGKR